MSQPASKRGPGRHKVTPSVEEQKEQCAKDMQLMKLHLLFDQIEELMREKVYSTREAKVSRSLLLCSRHTTIKTFQTDYAVAPHAGQ